MTAQTAGPDRCPKCGAAVKPGDPWCTLCYADLRPSPPEPVSLSEPEASPTASPPAYTASVVAGPDALTDPPAAPQDALTGPTWPCASCGADNRMDRDTCSACGASFLAGLRDQAPLLELPVVGDLNKLSRGHRFALAGGVVLAFVLLTLLMGVLL